jgi:hypothetical protein
MAMPKGGARKGAGRPKGGKTKRTREIAQKLALTGLTPLENWLIDPASPVVRSGLCGIGKGRNEGTIPAGIPGSPPLTQPSGVALAVELTNGWRLIAAAASYQRFHAMADRRQPAEPRPSGSLPDAPALLASATILCGRPVDLIAVDMPLALTPINARRVADDAVSRAYGGRKCGTHTPSAFRPGRISDALRESFERAGYPLRTDRLALPGVIEVYPHPALVELAGALERLPYKTSKVGSYWPLASRRSGAPFCIDNGVRS